MFYNFYNWRSLLRSESAGVQLNPLNAQIDPGGVWRVSIFFGLLFLIVSLAWRHRQEIGVLVGAGWSYALGRALYILEFPSFPFGDYNVAFISTAGQNFAELILIPGAVFMLGDRGRRYLWEVFKWTILVEVCLVWLKFPALMTVPYAGSLDLALIAMFVPFAPAWLAALSVFTILLHHGATAQSVLAAQALVFLFYYFKRRYAVILAAASTAALTLAAYIHTRGGSPFDSEGRLKMWKRAMLFWYHGGLQPDAVSSKWILIGVGPGTFMWTHFMMDGFVGEIFPWLHSDWLQVTWELGTLGGAAMLAITLLAAWRSRKAPRALAGVLGCAVCALSYHPLRYFPSALLVALVGFTALYGQKENRPEVEAAPIFPE